MSYNLDELRKMLAESEDIQAPIKKKLFDRSVTQFVTRLNLMSSENKVPSYHIYMEYRRNTQGKKCKPVVFFRTFKRLFEQKRTGTQRYYLVDGEIDISKEALEKSAKSYRRYYSDKKN